jgi:hypothetical protein
MVNQTQECQYSPEMGQWTELTVIQQLMSGGSTAPNAKETMLYRILTDEKRLGFGSEEEAAYLNLMLIQGAADTVRCPVGKITEFC